MVITEQFGHANNVIILQVTYKVIKRVTIGSAIGFDVEKGEDVNDGQKKAEKEFLSAC